MANQTKLIDIRSMLKAEIGFVDLASTTEDKRLSALLSNKQKFYASEWDWAVLYDRWESSVAARYNDVPTSNTDGNPSAINFEREVLVEVRYNNYWMVVTNGIGREQYNYVDSDLNQALDPIQKWRRKGETQFEVWPIPVTAQVVRFTGRRVLNPLLADTDSADLDDLLLVYSVAGDVLTDLKKPKAATMLRLAYERYMTLRADDTKDAEDVVLGREPQTEERKIVPITLVHA